MSLFRKIEISIAIGIVTTILFSIFSFAQTSAQIRQEILRLHVIANSDSAVDQNLKLAVRDAILIEGEKLFDGSVSVENAVSVITPEIERLTEAAREVIENYGFDYDVEISIDDEYFETRTYENITLPAGKYLSLVVRIGDAAGKNWWCVMFPPMCISAADEQDAADTVLNSSEMRLVNKKPKYEPRFKIVEWYESIKYKIFG